MQHTSWLIEKDKHWSLGCMFFSFFVETVSFQLCVHYLYINIREPVMKCEIGNIMKSVLGDDQPNWSSATQMVHDWPWKSKRDKYFIQDFQQQKIFAGRKEIIWSSSILEHRKSYNLNTFCSWKLFALFLQTHSDSQRKT